MAAISDACPPAMWREVVDRAVADAKAGDAKARDWLTRYLLGSEPPTLLEMATKEHSGQSADDEVAAAAKRHANQAAREARFDAVLARLK